MTRSNDNCAVASITGDAYQSVPSPVAWTSKTFPSLTFYYRFLANVVRSSSRARRGSYDDTAWAESSFLVLKDLESLGASVQIEGLDHVRGLESACVFVGNHMSTLETMVLPAIIQPIRDVTFVVKQSLLDYPLFKHIVGTRDPIAVTRQNARQDLKTVLTQGAQKLNQGICVVVFPQTTRSEIFRPKDFNTIGIKLAVKAGVPIVPVALKTNAWGNGNWIKDFGKIDPAKQVRFAFGAPLSVTGRGNDQHQAAIQFIESKLREWDTD